MLSVGWGGRGLLLVLSWLQDSDGDKSDDLVVDVSNEVRAGPDCRASVGLGCESVPAWWVLWVPAAVLTDWQPVECEEASEVGASGWWEEQSRALWVS